MTHEQAIEVLKQQLAYNLQQERQALLLSNLQKAMAELAEKLKNKRGKTI